MTTASANSTTTGTLPANAYLRVLGDSIVTITRNGLFVASQSTARDNFVGPYPLDSDYSVVAGGAAIDIKVTREEGPTEALVPAMLSTDANGNTVLVGAGVVTHTIGMGTNTLTVGKGGRFSTLQDAIDYRGTIGHTVLASGLTGTITYAANTDNRLITLSANLPAGIAYVKGNLGVRLGGPGNPILRCSFVGTSANPNTLRLRAPIAATFTAVQVDLYQIVPYGIAILPGTHLSITTGGAHIIPAFTKVFCPVPKGASIFHENTVGGALFGKDDSQNEVFIEGLVIGDATAKINSWVWEIPAASATNNQTLCDFGVFNCDVDSYSEDIFYFNSSSYPSAAFHLHNNTLRGTYDIVSPTLSRHLDVRNNTIVVASRGDFPSGIGDQGQPTGICLGGGVEASTYPHCLTTVTGNFIDITSTKNTANEGGQAVCVEIRQDIPSNAVVQVSGNMLSAVKTGGTDATVISAAVYVNGLQVTGAQTPTIVVSDNVIDSKITGGGAGTAYSLHSENAAYSIKRNGNRVINGTLGSNTDATGFI